MRVLRRGAAAATAFTAALALTLVPAGPARAAPWDGVDPEGSASDNSRVYIARKANVVITSGRYSGTVLGRIELRYSPTCRTVWARLVNYMNWEPGNAHEGSPYVHRNSDGRTYGRVACDRNSGRDTRCWTSMLNDANVTSYAEGVIDGYPTYGYVQARGRTTSY